jgi:DNA-binding SARP family transcriptional activator
VGVSRPSGARVPLGRTAALEVLVLLTLHPEGTTPAQVTEAMWPDVTRHAALGRFRTSVSALRTTLRTAADGFDVVVREGERYRLHPGRVCVDLWHLHYLVELSVATTDPHTRRRARHDAVAAYVGELAAGWDRPWLTAPREAARRHVLDALAALADDTDDPEQALRYLMTAIGHDPINEELYRRAAAIHTAAGNPAGAQALRQALHTHLRSAGAESGTAEVALGRWSRPTHEPT